MLKRSASEGNSAEKEKVLYIMIYFGRLKGLDRYAAKRWSQEYLERVALGDKAGLQLDKLSGGEQQKVQLGVTIMNEPELLILELDVFGLLISVLDKNRPCCGLSPAAAPAS